MSDLPRHPDVCVPGVVAVSDHVLVSDWLDGIPLARIIVGGTAAQRDRAGIMIIRFPVLGSGAGRAAARRSAPGQLPPAGRRAAGRARLRRCRPAAGRLPAHLALDSRIVIEQAKGVLAAERHIPVGEAFEVLRPHARGHAVSVRSVAEAVVSLGLRP